MYTMYLLVFFSKESIAGCITMFFSNIENIFLQYSAGVLSRAGADGTLFARTGPSPSLPLNYPDI